MLPDVPARGDGDGRWSQPYFSAAAFSTAIDRARLKPESSLLLAVRSLRRNATGSRFAANANSSMNDSDETVDCGPLGSRRLPVRSGVSHTSGRLTTCVDIRRFGIAYISPGVAALPGAGRSRLTPINCAINTVSGSL